MPPGLRKRRKMIQRDKETVSRHSVLEPEQRSVASAGRLRKERRGRGLRRLMPVFIVAFIGLLVARQEIPAVGDWWDKIVAPQTWAMKQLCRQAALEASANRAFARLIDGGEVHDTVAGYYVEGLVLGEMGPEGTEQRVVYSCYLDRNRQLVKINRLD